MINLKTEIVLESLVKKLFQPTNLENDQAVTFFLKFNWYYIEN